MISLYLLIIIIPAAGFPLEYLLKRFTGLYSSLAILASLLILIDAYIYGGNIYVHYTWFYNIDFGIYIDHLSLIMAFIVSSVSLIINVFSVFYMGKDPRNRTYFSEISIFVASMLGLVLSSNLVFTFLFWELVGIMSYLLIGFWYFKPNAAYAAKKSLLITRFGDLSFIIGLSIIYVSLNRIDPASPLSIPYLISNSGYISKIIGKYTLTLSLMFIFIGALSKSAQFPLHVWLPDSMEGPTTVSALIHAATMVTAGVYIIARLFPLFYYSYSMYTIAIIGSVTAILGALMGIAVNDMKRILAYSTMSQLGYMFSALGMSGIFFYSGVSFAMYQLLVHAVFKALLFMSAAVVMMYTLETRDIRSLGGLFRKMPATAILMLIGSITLAGIPPTAGFYSKDEIVFLGYAYFERTGNILPFMLLLITEAVTSIYIFRMYFNIFLGKTKTKAAENAKDPKFIYLIPLIILAFLSLFLGPFRYNFYKFIDPHVYIYTPPAYIEVVTVIAALSGIYIAYIIYNINFNSGLYNIIRNRFYIDRFYNYIANVFIEISFVTGIFDRRYDNFLDNMAGKIVKTGTMLKRIQNGSLEYYIIFLLGGLAAIFTIVEFMVML
ncbi:NADH-quinone oxidoreductase subunit 5 family protein [Picrophilus oshimae]|uniref:NADH-quinone oxidoreductase chain L n=1 Tax=Picrophilus torridus (strain ATCC 700027 / DSM 9790 / JCM 10055 / NBRC 100828 / KAW 2/3) TaxID=1122961 RepID=Q6L0I7_PICTO|nr:NADH-quinone oxidoreductase subunit L [Picrophilus oshimae]AAT43515.1 NADH-quinone oxidoreductase chain L [Picrophilus oshimae DSM 9789]